MGVPYELFPKLNPKKLKCFTKAHKIKMQEIDSFVYAWAGTYMQSCFMVSLEHCIAGKKAKSEYLKELVTDKLYNKERHKRGQEEVAMYEMSQRINILRATGLPESPI